MAICTKSGVDRHVFIVVSLCPYDCEYEASAANRNYQLGARGIFFWLFLGALEINFWRHN